mmetsp:Transcript_56474/g.156140  ORF Transcript_56474/g.156140 Transcript_56474/m.156140 type:complete len:309 (-) Transcript_56474:447-1373(-)
MAAIHLNTEVRRLLTGLGQETLEDGGEEAEALIKAVCLCGITINLSTHHVVRHLAALVDHRAAALTNALLRKKHGADARVVDDRVGDHLGLLGAAEGAHRAALFGVPQRVLERELGGRDALHRRADARGVDEGEHVVEAAVLGADEEALGAVELDLAGGRAVASHLVLDARHAHVVEVTHSPLIVHGLFRDQEERDALRASGGTRQAREDAVDDVVDHIMVTARDEDLGTTDLVRSIRLRLGLGAHLAEVRAALGLSQAHSARELTTNERRKPLVLKLIGTVSVDRVDGTLGEAREHEPGPVSGRDHL